MAVATKETTKKKAAKDAGKIVQSGSAAELLAAPEIQKAYLGL